MKRSLAWTLNALAPGFATAARVVSLAVSALTYLVLSGLPLKRSGGWMMSFTEEEIRQIRTIVRQELKERDREIGRAMMGFEEDSTRAPANERLPHPQVPLDGQSDRR